MNSFSALSDPTRRRIVEMLAEGGSLPSSDIGGHFSISAPAVSQHLKVLRDAGLLRMEKRAQQRIYSINPAAFDDMEEWLGNVRKFWNEQFDALDQFLQKEEKENDNDTD